MGNKTIHLPEGVNPDLVGPAGLQFSDGKATYDAEKYPTFEHWAARHGFKVTSGGSNPTGEDAAETEPRKPDGKDPDFEKIDSGKPAPGVEPIEFDKMTMKELREYADENKIPHRGTTKDAVIAEIYAASTGGKHGAGT